MYSYKVYSVNYLDREKTPIGRVLERRNKYRPNNLLGLLKVARKAFVDNPEKPFMLFLKRGFWWGLKAESDLYVMVISFEGGATRPFLCGLPSSDIAPTALGVFSRGFVFHRIE